MAGANLPAKKYKHSNPTVTRLQFEATGDTTRFIDIGMALSILNRKFYRQGVYYYVISVEVFNAEEGAIDIHVLPDNYITKNAWKRGLKTYAKMNALVDEVSQVGRPKYHDFKVYMSELHRSNGTLSPDLCGINGAMQNMPADEWQHSLFTSADDNQDGNNNADEFYVHMLGPHESSGIAGQWQSIGLITSYRNSRPMPIAAGEPNQPPSAPTDPLISIFDFSSEEQMNDIIENLDWINDQTPYDHDLPVGCHADNMQNVARIATDANIGRVGRASGFCAPFGLICVDPISGIQSDYRITLNLAVGTYHGVYAERA